MDDRRRTFMRELERALLEAISESADVHRTLYRMHREGYTLQLFLDCQPADGIDSAAFRPAAHPDPDSDLSSTLVPARTGARAETGVKEPAFRINSEDLTLLRALGIDPTRKSRTRK